MAQTNDQPLPYGISVRRAYTTEQLKAVQEAGTSLALMPDADRPAPEGWTVFLPHSCGRWEIGFDPEGFGAASKAQAMGQLERFILEAQAAYEALKRGEEFGDGD